MTNDLTPLSPEEMAQLEGQYDRIRRMLAALDAELVAVQVALAQALADFGSSRILVEQLRARKDIAVERARNLKALLAGF